MREAVHPQVAALSPKRRIEPVRIEPAERVPSAREVEDAERRILAMRNTPALLDETLVGVLAGILIGATVGIVAGSPGILAGAIIGAFIGAGAGVVWGDIDYLYSLRDDRLDRELGVTAGNIGDAPGPHPPARIGVFHSASMGAGGAGATEVDEGPNPWLHPHATE